MQKKIILFTIISSVVNTIHPVTKTKCRIVSTATGLTAGILATSGILGLGYYESVHGSEFFHNRRRETAFTGFSLGMATALLTYYLMMKTLEKSTPEYIFKEISDLLAKNKQDSLTNPTFAKNESIRYLKKLSNQAAQSLEKLETTYNDIQDTDLIKNYNELKNQIKLFAQLINLKIIELEIQNIEDTLILLNPKALLDQCNQLEELLTKSNQLEIDLHNISKVLSTQVILAKIIKLQDEIRFQLAQKLFDFTMIDNLMTQEFNSVEEFMGYAAAKFNKPWYLILAKNSLSIAFDKLNYALLLLNQINNPENKDLKFKLTDQIKRLLKDIEDKIFTVIKSPIYSSQMQAYEQNQHNEKQIKLLEEQKSLMEKYLKNERLLEESIASLRRSQDSKFTQLQQEIFTLENKIRDLKWELESQITSVKNSLRTGSRR